MEKVPRLLSLVGEVPRVLPYWSQFGAQGDPVRSQFDGKSAQGPENLASLQLNLASWKKIDKLIFWQKLQGNVGLGSKKGWALPFSRAC